MGGSWFRPPAVTPTAADGLPDLKLGEKILLRRMQQGETTRDAARALDIRQDCAYGWLRQARIRFGVTNSLELLKIVIERGLLEEES